MEQADQKLKTSPRDFFLHLGAIIALYVSAGSILALLFEIITYAFPRPFDAYSFSSATISWQVAALIIVFPIFIFLSWVLAHAEAATPAKRDLPVRKWLTYFTLFVAGIAILGDLVVLLTTFLQGEEITAGFALKVCAVLAVAGAIFAYYAADVKYGGAMKFKKDFALGTSLFIVIAIIVGFTIVGSPATQRVKRFDAKRVDDLRSIQWQVVNYWQHKQVLPQTLAELNDPVSGFVVPVDPQDESSYDYQAKEERAFMLCATFSLPSDARRASMPTVPKGELGMKDEYWKHDAGRQCFDVTIDPQLYPPIEEKE